MTKLWQLGNGEIKMMNGHFRVEFGVAFVDRVEMKGELVLVCLLGL